MTTIWLVERMLPDEGGLDGLLMYAFKSKALASRYARFAREYSDDDVLVEEVFVHRTVADVEETIRGERE